MATTTKFVYKTDGFEFTIYRVEKPTKSRPKTYWLLEEFAFRAANGTGRCAGEHQAELTWACIDDGQVVSAGQLRGASLRTAIHRAG
jgi:hypothetical protein